MIRISHFSAMFALLMIAAGTSLAQLPERYKTIPGEWSGYYWLSLSKSERLEFAIGFNAGYQAHTPDNKAAQTKSKEACLAKLANPDQQATFDCTLKSIGAKSEEYQAWESSDPQPGGTFGYVVDAADRFFAEPENRVMSINAAWIISKWKQEGRPQTEIDSLMESFKETYIRSVRKSCEMGWAGFGVTASRCEDVGSVLKPSSASPLPK